jgi:hypothetical protein
LEAAAGASSFVRAPAVDDDLDLIEDGIHLAVFKANEEEEEEQQVENAVFTLDAFTDFTLNPQTIHT